MVKNLEMEPLSLIYENLQPNSYLQTLIDPMRRNRIVASYADPRGQKVPQELPERLDFAQETVMCMQLKMINVKVRLVKQLDGHSFGK